MRTSYDGSELKVSIPELQEKAIKARTAIRNYRTAYDELRSVIDRMSAYWQGSAAEEARNQYRNATAALDSELADLEEYPQDLLEWAGAYEDVHTQLQNIIESIQITMLDFGSTY